MNSAQAVTIATIVIYFSILLLIGFFSSKKIKNSSDFIIAGRDLGFWVFVLLMIGTTASGMSILGVAGLGYSGGWPTFWEQIFVPLSGSICLILFGVKLSALAQKRGYMTVEDYFCDRYYSHVSMRLLATFTALIVSTIYLAGQYTAITIVLKWLLGLNEVTALIISAVIVMSYTLMGGLYAIAFTSLYLGILIIIGVVWVGPLIIFKVPDFNSVLNTINPYLTAVFYPSGGKPFFTPLFTFSFFFLITFGLSTAPHIINNVLAVKNRKHYRWAPVTIFVIYFVVIALIKISGFSVRAMVQTGILPPLDTPDSAFIAGIKYVLPEYAWAFIGTVVLAAVMSTTDRLLLTIGNCVSWDLYKKFVNKNADDRSIRNVNKVTMIIATIVTVLLAINPPKLLAFLIWAGIGIMFSCFAIPLIGGLYWKRATKQGAIASMSCGILCSIVLGFIDKFLSPLPMHFSFISTIIAAVVFILVSLLTPAPDKTLLQETDTGFFIRNNKRRDIPEKNKDSEVKTPSGTCA
ncbi:MAG: sodium:solute symporter family protein [Fibrobacter sp.]|nr:sodium:solute symporter family protein [Fibrobacter sp.]